MEQIIRPDSHQLCTERGIHPSEPGYERLVRYASVGEWLVPQFERKTSIVVPALNYSLMADLNLMGAIFDDTTDTGRDPNWHETYDPALFINHDSSMSLTSPNIGNASLVATTQADLNMSPLEYRDNISSAWNQLVVAMFEHKQAVMLGGSSSDIIGTRVVEAVSLSDLYAAILLEDPSSPLYSLFSSWLSIELASGNLMDTLMDQKEDKLNGHKPLGFRGNMAFLLVTVTCAVDLLKHPMTDSEDISYMVRKFAKHYLKPNLISYASSLRSRST